MDIDMSKRKLDKQTADGVGGTGDAQPEQKRAKTSDDGTEQSVGAFIGLLADVQALDVKLDRKANVSSLHPDAREKLKSLSRSLLHFLPAIKSLAEEEEHSSSSTDGPSTTQRSNPATPPVWAAIPATLTKWTVDDIPNSLPPLPAVLDPALEKGAFTHPGMAARPTDMNYERLEWVGDSYIYALSSNFIYATFPTLTPGKCSQLREMLVKNQTLREYSLKYGFDKRAQFPIEFGFEGRPGGTKVTEKERSKVLADLFEAYIAAVVLSDPASGYERAAAWLKPLWAGTIAKDIRQAETLQKKAAELPAKNQLAALIMAKGIRLRYEDAPPPAGGTPKQKVNKDNRAPLYTVNVYLDGWGETGKLLGWGTAQHKGEAGHKAAECALANKKLMQVYVERKRAHMAALEAQRKEE